MKKLISVLFIQSVFLVILCNSIYAEDFRGGREWMLRTVSAQGAALGRGIVAVIDNANTVFWNPGGTVFLNGLSCSYNNDYFNTENLHKTIRINSISFVTRLKNKYSIGLNGIYHRKKLVFIDPPAGNPEDYNYGISLGYKKGNIGFGINLKYLYSELGEKPVLLNAKGFSGDVGVLFVKNYKIKNRYPFRISYGVSVMNIFCSVKNITTPYSDYLLPLDVLPRFYRIGYNTILNIPNKSSKHNRFTISHNFEYFYIANLSRGHVRDVDKFIGIGLDFMLYEVFALRIGDTIQLVDGNDTFNGNYNGLSYGIGINLPLNRIYKDIPIEVKYDYARFPYNLLNEENYIKTNSINIQYLF